MIPRSEAMRDRLESEYEALERETSTIDMITDERTERGLDTGDLEARLLVVIARKNAIRKMLGFFDKPYRPR